MAGYVKFQTARNIPASVITTCIAEAKFAIENKGGDPRTLRLQTIEPSTHQGEDAYTWELTYLDA